MVPQLRQASLHHDASELQCCLVKRLQLSCYPSCEVAEMVGLPVPPRRGGGEFGPTVSTLLRAWLAA